MEHSVEDYIDKNPEIRRRVEYVRVIARQVIEERREALGLFEAYDRGEVSATTRKPQMQFIARGSTITAKETT
jgi:hypothetical protein